MNKESENLIEGSKWVFKCPNCDSAYNGVLLGDDDRAPEAGDGTICLVCYALLVIVEVDPQISLRAATMLEFDEFARSELGQRIMKQTRKIVTPPGGLDSFMHGTEGGHA